MSLSLQVNVGVMLKQNRNTTSMARQTSVFRTITRLVPRALTLALEEKKPILSIRLLRVSKVSSLMLAFGTTLGTALSITGDLVVFLVEN